VAATTAEPTARIANGAVVGAIDPTENVKALVTAGFKRVDDLLEERDRRFEANRSADQSLSNSELRRLVELAEAESRRVDEQSAMRENHAADLRDAEAKRIDAIRQVDVEARKADNERAATQATLLANNLATTAETLRNQVAAAAAAQSAAQQQLQQQQLLQLQQLFQPLSEKVAVLEQQSYKGAGEKAVADPALTAALLALADAQKNTATKLETIGAVQSQRTGQGIGAGQVVGYVLSGVFAVAALIGIIAYFAKP